MRVRQPRGSIAVEVRELIVRTAGSEAEIALTRAAGGELERDVASARWRLG